MYAIEITNHQTAHPVDEGLMQRAVEAVLVGEGIAEAEISVAVVDDAAIHLLNRRHLDHDYATDVLSFILERDQQRLEGEVVVSADTAAAQAEAFGWSAADELLLYVVHGVLHLVGYDDYSESDRQVMRSREQKYLAALGRTRRAPPE